MALFSARPRIGGLTVFTSGSASRLFMLDAMCANWVGPLAVAILQPILAGDVSGVADGLSGGTSCRSVVSLRGFEAPLGQLHEDGLQCAPSCSLS